jgi:hypothetical protein
MALRRSGRWRAARNQRKRPPDSIKSQCAARHVIAERSALRMVGDEDQRSEDRGSTLSGVMSSLQSSARAHHSLTTEYSLRERSRLRIDLSFDFFVLFVSPSSLRGPS